MAMILNRIKISEEATNTLQQLKSRTGLTPNLLCRLALCTSLNSGKVNNLVPLNERGQEFNRYTLFGDNEQYFVSLLKERCVLDGLDPEKEFLSQLKIHLNNGIQTIGGRLKDISDLNNLI